MTRVRVLELAQRLEPGSVHQRGRHSVLLLELEDQLGRVGRGEAAPLHGYCPDDIETNRQALTELELDQLELHSPVLPLLELLVRRIPAPARAARFALETAVLDLLGQQLELPAWQLLTDSSPGAPVPVAALIDAESASERKRQAAAALEAGYRTIKLKIRPGRPRLAELRELRDQIGSSARLRLDANQAFEANELLQLLPRLAELEPEFLEEPLGGLDLARTPDRVALLAQSPVPIALDESLQPVTTEQVIESGALPDSVQVLVLKPTALGGIARSLRLARAARRRGLGVVVSHTLEGPVAWAALGHLAVALDADAVRLGPSARDATSRTPARACVPAEAGPPRLAAGLAPHAGLTGWQASRPQLMRGSQIVADPAPGLGFELILAREQARVWRDQ